MTSFFTGSPEKRKNVSRLRPEQEGLYNQLQNVGQGRPATGVFGTLGDYYNDLMNENGQNYNALSTPAIRQYNEEIIPGISEQFAGGGGGQGSFSSSGFRNAQIQGATDLSERLGALRAQLRQQGAQGLQNLGQLGLGDYSQNMTTQQGSEGLLSSLAPAVGTAIGAFAGPAGAAAGNVAGNWIKNSFGGNKVGMNSSPYGPPSPAKASPQIGMSNFQLPGFLQR